MKKLKKINFLQIFIIFILILVGVSYFFNYKEGADSCYKVKVEDDFCGGKRKDCRVSRSCKTRGPVGRFGIQPCTEYNPAICVPKT